MTGTAVATRAPARPDPLMIAFTVPGEPVPYSKTPYVPTKQRAYMKSVGLLANRAMAGASPLDGPVRLDIRATYEPPASWSRAKQGRAIWKTSKPDATNIQKLIEDALKGICWKDDAQVVYVTGQKKYGIKSETVVTVMQLGVDP